MHFLANLISSHTAQKIESQENDHCCLFFVPEFLPAGKGSLEILFLIKLYHFICLATCAYCTTWFIHTYKTLVRSGLQAENRRFFVCWWCSNDTTSARIIRTRTLWHRIPDLIEFHLKWLSIPHEYILFGSQRMQYIRIWVSVRAWVLCVCVCVNSEFLVWIRFSFHIIRVHKH